MTTELASTAANTVYNWVVLGTSASTGSRYLTIYEDVDAGTESAVTRVATSGVFGSPTAGDGTNTATASFVLPAAQTTIDGAGIFDASSGGNEICRWTITPRTYAASATCVLNINDLFVNVDGVA